MSNSPQNPSNPKSDDKRGGMQNDPNRQNQKNDDKKSGSSEQR